MSADSLQTVGNLLIIALYAGLSTWALSEAVLIYIEYGAGLRERHALWGVLAFVLLAVFFLFLSISGGSHPQVARRDIAVEIRLVAAAVLLAGIMRVFFRARSHIIVQWKREGQP